MALLQGSSFSGFLKFFLTRFQSDWGRGLVKPSDENNVCAFGTLDLIVFHIAHPGACWAIVVTRTSPIKHYIPLGPLYLIRSVPFVIGI